MRAAEKLFCQKSVGKIILKMGRSILKNGSQTLESIKITFLDDRKHEIKKIEN